MNWYNRQLKIAKRGWATEELEKVKKLVEEGMSFERIAKLFGVSDNSIRQLNAKYRWVDLELRRKEKEKKRGEDDKKIVDLYLLPPKGRGMAARRIRREYGFSLKRVQNALERLGLSEYYRNVSETNRLKYDEETIKKIDYLYKPSPEGLGLPMSEVANRMGTTRSSLKKFFEETGRDARTAKEQRELFDPQKSNKWEEVEANKEEIQKMLNEGYSKRQIAELFEVGNPLMMKMLDELNVFRDFDKIKQEAEELLGRGMILTDVSKKLKVDPRKIKKMLDIKTKAINYHPGIPISLEEKNEMIRLHVEEELRPTEISKKINRPIGSIVDTLTREGVYERLRGDWVRFNPTKEQIKQIDKWYALPPKGEGRSLVWIGYKFGLSGNQMGYWFHKTGRPVRSFQEQVATEATKEDTSLAKIIDWEEKGGLKGLLTGFYPTRQQSVNYLNMYVNRLLQQGASNNRAFSTRTKYMKIINNHTYPDEIQQGATI
jgi:transposase